MDFSKVKSLTIPEGNVVKIMSGDVVLWTKPKEPAVNSGEQRKEKGLAIKARPFPVSKPSTNLKSRNVKRFQGILWNLQVRQSNSKKLIP